MPRLISTERGQGLNGRWLRLVGPSLSTITIEPADLPEDVLAFLYRLLDLGGTYGDPEADDPIQYDELRFEHDQGDVEIVVYNRAIPAVHDRQRGSSGFTRCAAGREDIAGSRHPA